jgi:hypothetical protein
MRRRDSGAPGPNGGLSACWDLGEVETRRGAHLHRAEAEASKFRRRRSQLGGRVAEIRSGRLEAYLARFGRRLAFSFNLLVLCPCVATRFEHNKRREA